MKHMVGGGTLQAQLIEKLEEEPKALWTRDDVMEYLEVEERAAENALYNAWRTGKICRHVDRHPENNLYQYALKIPTLKSAVYEMSNRGQSTPTGKKKKGQLPTAREVRTMFAQTQNQMAKMEDMMIAVVEEYEELEKMINKIKNITS